MSYARFTKDSDVYVYLDVGGYLNCCACALRGDYTSEKFYTTHDMLDHLDRHVDENHSVPPETFEELRAEAAENDAWIKDKEQEA